MLDKRIRMINPHCLHNPPTGDNLVSVIDASTAVQYPVGTLHRGPRGGTIALASWGITGPIIKSPFYRHFYYFGALPPIAHDLNAGKGVFPPFAPVSSRPPAPPTGGPMGVYPRTRSSVSDFFQRFFAGFFSFLSWEEMWVETEIGEIVQ